MVRSLLLAALPLVAAWPQVMEMNERMQRRDVDPGPRSPLFLSKRPNTSQQPLEFNAEEQFVNVTQGSGREFVAPTASDIRGQCPGLNAAANHGFIPHNGILSTPQSKFEIPLWVQRPLTVVQLFRGLPMPTTCLQTLPSSYPSFRSLCEY